MSDRLFTPRFFIMFGYSFTVFVSVFQLLPAAPYRVLALGGSTAVAGFFHGFLTYSSALSAPATGPLCDRLGHRPVLVVVSVLLAGFTASYAFIANYHLMFAVVFVHGLIWSALMSASAAYMTASIPHGRRAEGLGYWGLASVLAMGTAPAIGFWVYHHGWRVLCAELTVLNLLMAVIAWYLPDDRAEAADARREIAGLPEPLPAGDLIRSHVEWRVLVLSLGLTMITFGYGSLTSFSAFVSDELRISPRSLFLTAMAVAMLVSRLAMGRTLDGIGHRRVLLLSLITPAIGLFLLAASTGRALFVTSAVIFGAAFGLVYPAYSAYVMEHVTPARRGAAFGAILAAFDSGIGSGATIMGWLIENWGFRVAYFLAAALALCALPYFLLAERRLGFLDRRRLAALDVSP